MSHNYEPSQFNLAEELDLLINQFKGQPNLTGLLKGLLEPFKDLSQNDQDLFYNRWLENAHGVQLDNLGIEIGLRRNGRSDEQYRNDLRVQIFINTSGGLINEQLIALSLYVRGFYSEIYEHFPASYSLSGEASPENVNRNVFERMDRLSSAGVKLTHISLSDATPEGQFKLAPHDWNWGDLDYFHGLGAVGPDFSLLEFSDGSVLDLSDGSELVIWDGKSEDRMFFGGQLAAGINDTLRDLVALELSDGSVLELSDGSIFIMAV